MGFQLTYSFSPVTQHLLAARTYPNRFARLVVYFLGEGDGDERLERERVRLVLFGCRADGVDLGGFGDVVEGCGTV